jgi:hypothetical protein
MKYNPFKTLPRYHLPPTVECLQKTGCSTWIIYEGDEIDESLNSFLFKILNAVGLEPEKNCFVKTIPSGAKERIVLRGIQHLLNFGIPSERLGWSIKLPLYQPVLIGNSQVLHLENLSVYYQEINSKTRVKSGHLWQVLKNHFNV